MDLVVGDKLNMIRIGEKKLNPLVSIIIPVYNVKSYLARCIESLLNQTYNQLEIILVNDGSTDDSLSICEFYAKEDPRVIVINKENGGVSSARNRGIIEAHGEFITFVDSDDWIEKDMIKYLVENIFKYNAQISICTMCNQANIYTNQILLMSGEEALRNVLLKKYSAVWGQLYKADIVKKNLFNEELVNNEDIVYLINIYKNTNKVVHDLSMGLYHYNVEPRKSLTSTKSISSIESQLKATQYVQNLFLKSIYQMEINVYLFYTYYNCSVDLIRLDCIKDPMFNKIYCNFKEMFKNQIFKKNISVITKLKSILLFISPNLFKLFLGGLS